MPAMVLPGQFLERPAVVTAGALTLEGLSHRGERPPPLLLCPPLGEGGGMDAAPIAEMAWAAARAGHASLRFQHRGTGASQGAPDPARAVEDAEAARRHLAETCGLARVAVAGLASGCDTAMALAAAGRGVARLVLVAPPRLAEAAPSVPTLVLLPERAGAAALAAWEALLLAGRGAAEAVPGSDERFLVGLPLLGRRAAEWLAAER